MIVEREYGPDSREAARAKCRYLRSAVEYKKRVYEHGHRQVNAALVELHNAERKRDLLH